MMFDVRHRTQPQGSKELPMKRTLTTKLTLASAAAALALGAAACEVEDNGADPGTEDPLLDDGAEDDGL
jgi:hypothetical protein